MDARRKHGALSTWLTACNCLPDCRVGVDSPLVPVARSCMHLTSFQATLLATEGVRQRRRSSSRKCGLLASRRGAAAFCGLPVRPPHARQPRSRSLPRWPGWPPCRRARRQGSGSDSPWRGRRSDRLSRGLRPPARCPPLLPRAATPRQPLSSPSPSHPPAPPLPSPPPPPPPPSAPPPLPPPPPPPLPPPSSSPPCRRPTYEPQPPPSSELPPEPPPPKPPPQAARVAAGADLAAQVARRRSSRWCPRRRLACPGARPRLGPPPPAPRCPPARPAPAHTAPRAHRLPRARAPVPARAHRSRHAHGTAHALHAPTHSRRRRGAQGGWEEPRLAAPAAAPAKPVQPRGAQAAWPPQAGCHAPPRPRTRGSFATDPPGANTTGWLCSVRDCCRCIFHYSTRIPCLYGPGAKHYCRTPRFLGGSPP